MYYYNRSEEISKSISLPLDSITHEDTWSGLEHVGSVKKFLLHFANQTFREHFLPEIQTWKKSHSHQYQSSQGLFQFLKLGICFHFLFWSRPFGVIWSYKFVTFCKVLRDIKAARSLVFSSFSNSETAFVFIFWSRPSNAIA